MSEPLCVVPDCKASNHCPICGVHHPVDDMVTWCLEHKGNNKAHPSKGAGSLPWL